MWCTTCRQDVPGIASEKPATFSCARCGHAITVGPLTLGSNATSGEAHSTGDDSETRDREPSTDSSQGRPPIDLDNWQFDDDLRRAEQTLAMTARTNRTGKPSSLRAARFSSLTGDNSRSGEASDIRSLSAGNLGVGKSDFGNIDIEESRVGRPTTEPSAAIADDRRDRNGLLAWSVLLVGVTAFVCGGVLLGWSFFDGRQQLWNLGLPVTIVGQAALLIGLMLQVERIWHNSRRASQRLRHVDRRLNDLQQTTAILEHSHGVASGAFYCHMAEGANPHMLLADLKGQLDMLAVKVAQQD